MTVDQELEAERAMLERLYGRSELRAHQRKRARCHQHRAVMLLIRHYGAAQFQVCLQAYLTMTMRLQGYTAKVRLDGSYRHWQHQPVWRTSVARMARAVRAERFTVEA